MSKRRPQRPLLKLTVFTLCIGFAFFFGVDLNAKSKTPGPADIHRSLWPVSAGAKPDPVGGATPHGAGRPAAGGTAPQGTEKPAAVKTAGTKQQRGQTTRSGEAVPAMAQAEEPAVEAGAPPVSFLNRLSSKLGEALRLMMQFIFSGFIALFNQLLS